MIKLKTILIGIFMFCVTQLHFANNVSVTNMSMTNDTTISFDISWENSWRVNTAPNNHDAVWVFIKKHDCASMRWSHVNLSSSITDHSADSPLEVYIDGKDLMDTKGIFLRRSSIGFGNINAASISLMMTGLTAGEYDFQVFCVEMVQIPTGAFYAGDGNYSIGSFREGSSNSPYLVSSEDAISSDINDLYTASSTYRPVNLPASYPKGYNEIYAMKYEISQGQYTDFVNTLTSDQAANRSIIGTTNRLNVTGAWPTHFANTPHRAMNFLAWADFLAYLDWSALRPMTELEFEKIARGPSFPVGGEYAWGTSFITDANTLVSDGTDLENATNPIGEGSGIANYNNNVILGPLRVGFASKPGTNRRQSGASYYGLMELSGNLWEQVITTRIAVAVAFQAILGDGELTTSATPGFADVTSWPSTQASTTSTTSATGKGKRGGSWNTSSQTLRTSDRTYSYASDGRRLNENGGRGVR